MATIILSSESQKDLNLIVQLAKKLGISTKKLSKDEIEDIALSIAIKKGRTGESVETDAFLKELDNAG
jgi:hypothetical protein